jgi:hypothetical protein
MHPKETHVLRNSLRIIPFVFLLLFGVTNLAHAQGGSAYFGMGSATDSSTGTVDPFGDGSTLSAPSMNGLFGIFGGDAMFKPNLGVGVAVSTRFKQAAYADFNYRPTFYDFNAIYQPLPPTSRVALELQGGIGGAKISFYAPTGATIGPSSIYFLSTNHFQVHGAVGVRFYATEHVFIRPQVDIHYVTNYNEFGRGAVPEFTVSVGYSFAR